MVARSVVLAALCAAAHAAVIRGTVVEHQTGRPLTRATVTVQPVAGTPGSTQTLRTNSFGAFEIAQIPAGVYLITASRRGFAPLQYGQKSWRASGIPIVLEDSGAVALSLRLQRYGSIAGTVIDENDVGLPEQEVVAFRNTRPPQMAARATTDDRGVYRIWGLEPGTYLVRTLGKQYDDAGYLPTFSRQTARVDDALPVEVALDQQTSDIHVRPIPGRLYKIAGRAYVPYNSQINLTLMSDTGPEFAVSDSSGNFEFNPAPPGSYELLGQSTTDRRFGGGTFASWTPILLDRDSTDLRLTLTALPTLTFSVETTKGEPVETRTLEVRYRKKDLSGDGKLQTLSLQSGRTQIAPGRWEFGIAPMANYYVASFAGPRAETPGKRADGWNELTVTGQQVPVKIVLAPDPATIHGKVTTAGQDPIAGAPVFLEAYDLESRRRLTEVRTTRADVRGQYRFFGLPPGVYRLLATYEFQSPDSAVMDAAPAKTVTVEAGRDHLLDLDLWTIR
jgi:hypothetical protein